MNGTLTDGGSYTIVSGGPSSYMYLTTRFTTDNRSARQTPTVTVRWREAGNDLGGRIRVRIRYNKVNADGSLGAYNYLWGPDWYDVHADNSWETRTTSFTLGDFRVQDIRIHIYNYTDGNIHVDMVKVEDDTAG